MIKHGKNFVLKDKKSTFIDKTPIAEFSSFIAPKPYMVSKFSNIL